MPSSYKSDSAVLRVSSTLPNIVPVQPTRQLRTLGSAVYETIAGRPHHQKHPCLTLELPERMIEELSRGDSQSCMKAEAYACSFVLQSGIHERNRTGAVSGCTMADAAAVDIV